MSIRGLSLEVVVHIQNATDLTEKLWKSFLSFSIAKLDGEIESDEFYIKSGLKGRSYHDEIVKIRRKHRKRGLKPWRVRATF